MADPWAKFPLVQQPQSQGGGFEQYPTAQSTGMDIAKSAAIGVPEGMIDLAGLPGNIRNLIQSGTDWAANKLGMDPALAQQAVQGGVQAIPGMSALAQPMAPTSDQIQRGVESVTGQFYQPQTIYGQYANAITRTAPSAAIGPGSTAVKIASGLGSAVGSETAGQIAHRYVPDYETAARIGGGILGGGIAGGKAAGPVATAEKTTAELRTLKNAAYAAAKQSGNTIGPRQYRRIVSDVRTAAQNEGINPDTTGGAVAGMKALERNLDGTAKTPEQMDRIRQQLKADLNVMKPQDARLIGKMVQEFDDAYTRVAPPVYKEARKLNTQLKRSEFVDDLNNRIALKQSRFTQSGLENAIRDRFRNLAESERKMRKERLTPAEREAVAKVAMGSRMANALRMGGKFAPTSALSFYPAAAIGGSIASILGIPAGTTIGALISGGGALSRMGATALTKSAAAKAEALMRGGPQNLKRYLNEKAARRGGQIARAILYGNVAEPTDTRR